MIAGEPVCAADVAELLERVRSACLVLLSCSPRVTRGDLARPMNVALTELGWDLSVVALKRCAYAGGHAFDRTPDGLRCLICYEPWKVPTV